PTVSIGNVGQLTIDLLISSLQAPLVGHLSSDCVVPVVGRDAFDLNSNLLTTSLDVHECEKHKLVILQQRSPIIKRRQQRFIDELTKWIKDMKFPHVIVYTSVLACERIDSQLYGPQCRFMSTNNNTHLNMERLAEIFPCLETRQDIVAVADGAAVNQPYIPGSGITKKLLYKFNNENIESVVLLRFSYEADNIPDAVELFNLTNTYFNWIDVSCYFQVPENMKMPPSWSLLFGSHFDQIIYQ
ncbi:hypothetical protein HELRODRAFT_74476, partial [Helobdella robusta]|uniref:Proteasome assembly chaperone 2 n=1 Tax=Helobdella robusta TaxID=6412 RepID=T1G1R7_HELRO